MPPISPARALHNILLSVERESDNPHAYQAWGAIAGASVTTGEFAAFHAECAALLSEVLESLRALPAGSQTRYLKYVPSWWSALVEPRNDWAAVKSIATTSDLDHLESLADLVEQRAQAVRPVNVQTLSMLRETVGFLLGHLERPDNDVPEPVRDAVVTDLSHVMWLLEKVDTFGLDHAVAAAEQVTGKTVVAATRSRSKTLKSVAAGLVAVLGIIGVATGQVDEIATNVKHTFSITSDTPAQAEDSDPVQVTVNQIVKICTPKELGPGQGAQQSADDDVIDAEVIDDDQ